MHVAVTGASSGIGEALVREFARDGACITMVARRREKLEEIASSLSVKTFLVSQDLTDYTHAADWIAPAEAALGPIDILISNAGLLTLGPVASLSIEEGERMLHINLMSPSRIMRAILPGMLSRKSGVIVNVTSVAALVASPDWVYQAASKAGSATFSELLHAEVKGSGVHVMTVYPGLTDTPMTQSGLDAYGRKGMAAMIPLGDTATLAKRLKKAIQKKKARLIYPRFYTLTRWFPRISNWLAGKLTPRLKTAR